MVGYIIKQKEKNKKNIVAVDSASVGGLVGFVEGDTYTEFKVNSASVQNVYGFNSVGGLVGYITARYYYTGTIYTGSVTYYKTEGDIYSGEYNGYSKY